MSGQVKQGERKSMSKLTKLTLNIAFCYGVSVTSLPVFIDISVVRYLLFIKHWSNTQIHSGTTQQNAMQRGYKNVCQIM